MNSPKNLVDMIHTEAFERNALPTPESQFESLHRALAESTAEVARLQGELEEIAGLLPKQAYRDRPLPERLRFVMEEIDWRTKYQHTIWSVIGRMRTALDFQHTPCGGLDADNVWGLFSRALTERDQLATRQREMRAAVLKLAGGWVSRHCTAREGYDLAVSQVLAILDSPTQAQARTGEKAE